MSPRVSTVNRSASNELSSGELESCELFCAVVPADGISDRKVSTRDAASPFLTGNILILATSPGVSSCSMNWATRAKFSGAHDTTIELFRSLTEILVVPKTPLVTMG